MTQTTKNQLTGIRIFPSPSALGETAAFEIAAELRERLASQSKARMIFAAAPSQSEMLRALARAIDIDWPRVEAFHMDEYIGLTSQAPQRFGHWLKRQFFEQVPLGRVHLIDPELNPLASADAYAAALSEAPIDIVCLGIGMNGHLAFNDPPADFKEKRDVRVVTLDIASRIQQVEEGLFAALQDVPEQAITLSIPRLLRADRLFCCVSGSIKSAAVARAFSGDVSPLAPASILREHAGCHVFLDTQAAADLVIGDY